MKKIILTLAAVFTFGYASAQDVRLPEKPKTANYKDYSTEQTGFWCAAEVDAGSTVKFKGKNAQMASATYTGGYMFNEYLKAGVGFGVKYYFNNSEALRNTDIKWSFPIFANVRGNIISQDNRGAVPFWSFSAGGAIRDGFFFSPTIGYRFGETRSSWLVGISYTFSEIPSYPDYDKTTNAFTLKLGYEF